MVIEKESVLKNTKTLYGLSHIRNTKIYKNIQKYINIYKYIFKDNFICLFLLHARSELSLPSLSDRRMQVTERQEKNESQESTVQYRL